MNAHQHRVVRVPFSGGQGDVFALVEVAAVADGLELAVARGQPGFGYALNQPFLVAAVGDDLGDAEDFQAVGVGELLQLGQADIVPSSSIISQTIPAGYKPARLQRSTMASVWPGLASTRRRDGSATGTYGRDG